MILSRQFFLLRPHPLIIFVNVLCLRGVALAKAALLTSTAHADMVNFSIMLQVMATPSRMESLPELRHEYFALIDIAALRAMLDVNDTTILGGGPASIQVAHDEAEKQGNNRHRNNAAVDSESGRPGDEARATGLSMQGTHVHVGFERARIATSGGNCGPDGDKVLKFARIMQTNHQGFNGSSRHTCLNTTRAVRTRKR